MKSQEEVKGKIKIVIDKTKEYFQSGNYRISAPVITGGSEEWAKERLIRVEKDAVAKDGLSHYEYCVSKDKSTKECKWEKTETKNTKVITTGVWYVTFRGVDVNGKKGQLSNTEVVYIDNENPVIKDIKIKEKTASSISIKVEAEDNHSGVATYEYSIDGDNYEKGISTYTYKELKKNTEYKIYVEEYRI